MLIENLYVTLFDGSTNVGLSQCVTLFDDNTNVCLSPFYVRNVYKIDPDFRMGQGQIMVAMIMLALIVTILEIFTFEVCMTLILIVRMGKNQT